MERKNTEGFDENLGFFSDLIKLILKSNVNAWYNIMACLVVDLALILWRLFRDKFLNFKKIILFFVFWKKA